MIDTVVQGLRMLGGFRAMPDDLPAFEMRNRSVGGVV